MFYKIKLRAFQLFNLHFIILIQVLDYNIKLHFSIFLNVRINLLILPKLIKTPIELCIESNCFRYKKSIYDD